MLQKEEKHKINYYTIIHHRIYKKYCSALLSIKYYYKIIGKEETTNKRILLYKLYKQI